MWGYPRTVSPLTGWGKPEVSTEEKQMAQPSLALSTKIKELNTSKPKRALPVTDRTGISFSRYFTQKLEAGKTPYDEIQWELRSATIGNDKGAVIFEQQDVLVPADWSQTATNIVASKYFHGKLGSPDRETSVGQLVHRVVGSIAGWGKAGKYFQTDDDAEGVLQFAGVV